MGCRHYFVVDRVEELVGEGRSRSAWRAHEHENFQFVSQQNVAIQIFWNRFPPRLTLNALIVSTQRVSPFYRDLILLLNWSSCCHERNVFETLFVSKQRVSPFYRDLHLHSRKKRVSISGLPVLSWFGFGFNWVSWELFAWRATSPSACRATSEHNSFIQSCFKEIFGGGRGDAYTFSYMTSSVSIRTTFGIQ